MDIKLERDVVNGKLPSKNFSMSCTLQVYGSPRNLTKVSEVTIFWRFIVNSNSSGFAAKTGKKKEKLVRI